MQTANEIKVDLSKALEIEGWMTPEELEWLAKKAVEFDRPGAVIVEIGCWKGRSTRAILDHIQHATLYAVDTFQGSPGELEHAEAHHDPDGVYRQFLANVEDSPNRERLRILKMDSVEAARMLADAGIKADWVFIDGDHSYEGVKRDIEAFLPLTKHLISGHDFTDPRFEGLRLAVAEAFGRASVVYGTSIWRQHLKDGEPVEPVRPDRPRIFVGTPSYKGEHPMFLSALRATSVLLEDKYDIVYGAVYGDAMVDRARANVLGKYLATGPYDIFVGIDDDISWHPTAFDAIVTRMLMSQAEHPNDPDKWIHCLGMPYPFKQDDGRKAGKPVLRPMPGAIPNDGLLEVRWQGGGLYAVTDYALKKMLRAYPELAHYNHANDTKLDERTGFWTHGDQTWALWLPMLVENEDWGPGKKELISEDWAFMERLRRCGFKVYIDVYALATHWVGEKCYQLQTVKDEAALIALMQGEDKDAEGSGEEAVQAGA